ncbi:hypothetical protein WDW89_18225 [Deltaproteobacteria bacterium TL4]
MGSQTGELFVWDFVSNQRSDLSLKDDSSTALAVDSKKSWLALGREEGSIEVYDLQSKKQVLKLDSKFNVPWTMLKFSQDGQGLLSGNPKGEVALWNLNSGTLESLFKGHTEAVQSLAFHPKGRIVSTGSSDGSIKFWDRTQEVSVITRKVHEHGFSSLKGRKNDVGSSRLLLSSSWKGAIKLVRLRGRLYSKSKVLFQREGDGLPVVDIALSDDGKLMLIAKQNGDLEFLSGTDYAQSRTLTTGLSSLNLMALSPDQQEVTVGDKDGGVLILNLQSGSPQFRLNGHRGAINAIAYSPDGKLILTGGTQNSKQHLSKSDSSSVRIWDAKTGAEIQKINYDKDVSSLVWSPDGKTFLTTSSEDKTARLWNLKKGHLLQVYQGHSGSVLFAAFHPDGKRIITAGSDKHIILWDVTTGHQILSIETPDGVSGNLCFSSNGLELWTADFQGKVKIYPAADWNKSIKTLNEEKLTRWQKESSAILKEPQRVAKEEIQPLPTTEKWVRYKSAAQEQSLKFSDPVHEGVMKKILSVRADFWPPFNGDPKASRPGYMIEVLKAIFEPQGYVVDYQILSWDQALESVRKGEFDLGRPNQFDFFPHFLELSPM